MSYPKFDVFDIALYSGDKDIYASPGMKGIIRKITITPQSQTLKIKWIGGGVKDYSSTDPRIRVVNTKRTSPYHEKETNYV